MAEDKHHHYQWVTICRLEDIEPGRAKYIEWDGRAYSVVRDSQNPDTVRIFDDACPHAGASMSYGCVRDNCFVCPAHQWEFSMTDGRNPDNPAIRLPTHPGRIKSGQVQIRTCSK